MKQTIYFFDKQIKNIKPINGNIKFNNKTYKLYTTTLSQQELFTLDPHFIVDKNGITIEIGHLNKMEDLNRINDLTDKMMLPEHYYKQSQEDNSAKYFILFENDKIKACLWILERGVYTMTEEGMDKKLAPKIVSILDKYYEKEEYLTKILNKVIEYYRLREMKYIKINPKKNENHDPYKNLGFKIDERKFLELEI